MNQDSQGKEKWPIVVSEPDVNNACLISLVSHNPLNADHSDTTLEYNTPDVACRSSKKDLKRNDWKGNPP